MGATNPQYLCIQEYTSDLGSSGYITTDPYWIIAVWNFDYIISYNRTLQTQSPLLSPIQSTLTRVTAPIIITDDCINLSVSNQKTSHTNSLSATFKQGNTNYLSEILPGDWCMAWIMNDKATYDRILLNLQLGQPANDFQSGLKFIGRVQNLEKVVDVDSESGRKSVAYSFSALGFAELDSMIHLDATLASGLAQDPNILNWLPRVGIDPRQIFTTPGTSNVSNLIALLLNLFFGTGIGGNLIPSEQANVLAAGAAVAKEAPFSYVIPPQIASVLGKGLTRSKVSGVSVYADILQLVLGVQGYLPGVLIPSLLTTGAPNPFVAPFYGPLLGTFLPYFPEITNRSFWEILRQFLNPTVNEVYTCLQAGLDGSIQPTLVVRQIPFTTDAMVQNPPPTLVAALPKTPFSTLPRWVIHPLMVKSYRIGRSNTTRINFLQIIGVSPTPDARDAAYQEVLNSPIIDNFDILRHGVRTYITNVSCSNTDLIGNAPSAWMGLAADWLMGSHLTFRGTIETVGISAPICLGDNVEFDNCMGHLEGIVHSARVDTGTGKKSFTTTLAFSNGLDINGTAEASGLPISTIQGGSINPNTPLIPSFSVITPIYPGLKLTDNTQYEPGLTIERDKLPLGGG